jgi:hypothetical protein
VDGGYCVLVLKKLQPGEQASSEVARSCSMDPKAAAAAAPAASIVLARVYQNTNWTGYWTEIRGNDGPCDSVGYNIPNLNDANWTVGGISSYRVYNNCWASMTWDAPAGAPVRHGSADHCWDVAYVGAAFNDRVGAMNLWYSLSCV